MTLRENLIESLEGRTPERIPFTTYAEFGFPEPELRELIDRGFSQTQYAGVVSAYTPDVERISERSTHNKRRIETVTLKTPVGSVSQVSADGWIQSYFLKTPEDYKVMEYIVRRTRFAARYEEFEKCERIAGENGITLISLPRSPMQTILVDYAGLEQLSYHMAEDMEAVLPLYEALYDSLTEQAKIIARGPGRYVHMTENMTAETWGLDRFLRYHMPVYESVLPILHRGGKKVYTHYDGKLKVVSNSLKDSPIDGIESFTVPPEGDMSYREIREALPETYIWSNISLSVYALPDDELRRWIHAAARDCAPDKRLFAFAILEDIPPNWREKIPVILDALRE